MSEHEEFERLNESLKDPETLRAYKEPLDGYRVGLVPRILGGILVGCGTLLYGRAPSYLKFRAIEVIARVPYHSWSSTAFTLLTLFYADEKRALALSHLARFARFASDNETMHVVVISALTHQEQRAGIVRYTLIPVIFAFFYFWMSYLVYLVSPRAALEINYLFEQHAFDQYSLFLSTHAEILKRKPIESAFLTWYGRHPRSQYEFFESVRNDEIIHRNQSIHQIRATHA